MTTVLICVHRCVRFSGNLEVLLFTKKIAYLGDAMKNNRTYTCMDVTGGHKRLGAAAMDCKAI